MPANEDIILFETCDITGLAGVAITGKRFVDVTTGLNPALATTVDGAMPTFGAPAAGAKALGVAIYDQPTVGKPVGIVGTPGRIVPVTAAGTIAAGAEVEVQTDGRVVTLASGKAVGKAVSAGTTGNDVFIKLA